MSNLKDQLPQENPALLSKGSYQEIVIFARPLQGLQQECHSHISTTVEALEEGPNQYKISRSKLSINRKQYMEQIKQRMEQIKDRLMIPPRQGGLGALGWKTTMKQKCLFSCTGIEDFNKVCSNQRKKNGLLFWHHKGLKNNSWDFQKKNKPQQCTCVSFVPDK